MTVSIETNNMGQSDVEELFNSIGLGDKRTKLTKFEFKPTGEMEMTVKCQWVYKRTERSLWTVGYYDPSGKWESESDHNTPGEAAERVHWLNGGEKQSPTEG